MITLNHTSEKTRWIHTSTMDFRKLNHVTADEDYYMSLIEDILDQVKDCKYLSKVDPTRGFTKSKSSTMIETKLIPVLPGYNLDLRECNLSF